MPEIRVNAKVQSPLKITFETFRRFGSWERYRLETKEPSCFNGKVSIRKYRVTVEEVPEPKEVLEARLRKLWVECDNHHHHWSPLQNAAVELGSILSHNERDKHKPTKA